MSLATYSPEMKIKTGLRSLNCAEYNFAKIAGVVSKSRLAQGLSDDPLVHKEFEPHDAEALLNVLTEMRELQNSIDVPIDWSRVDKIAIALTLRRISKIEKELELEPNPHLRSATEIAVEQVNSGQGFKNS